MALAVPAGRTATVAGMAAGLADHTVASAGMVAALAVRPGYTGPVAVMAAVPAGRTATVAGMAAAPAGHTVAEPFVHTAAYAALAGHTVAYADTVTELAVLPDYMVLELTALPDHSVPDFAQPSQLFPAPHSAQKSTRHQLRQYLLLYSVHPCCHLPPM